MASREKYIFHMLFGAFHITPRISKSCSVNIVVSDKKLTENIIYFPCPEVLDKRFASMDDKDICCGPQYQNKDFSAPGTMSITEFSTLTDVRCRNGIWSQMEHILRLVNV